MLAPLVLLLLLLYLWLRNRRETRRVIRWRWIAAGLGAAALGLVLPDPAFAAKRIHVTEYMLLSLLVRLTLSHRQSGTMLLLCSWLVTSLLGIHDEILQGIHPARTCGLMDILVNTLGALAGSFIWHGIDLSCAQDNVKAKTDGVTCYLLLYFLWLALGSVLLAIPITACENIDIPLWTMLPLAAVMVFFFCLKAMYGGRPGHGTDSVSYYGFCLLLYPPLINGFEISFF